MISALQIDRGDAEVAVAELALDDNQRHAFVRHLDSVRVTKLVRRKAPANPGRCRSAAHLGPSCGVRPPSSAGRAGDDAEQRSHREREAAG
jgi:hypothetical protein